MYVNQCHEFSFLAVFGKQNSCSKSFNTEWDTYYCASMAFGWRFYLICIYNFLFPCLIDLISHNTPITGKFYYVVQTFCATKPLSFCIYVRPTCHAFPRKQSSWVLSAPAGSHVGPINLAIKVGKMFHWEKFATPPLKLEHNLVTTYK